MAYPNRKVLSNILKHHIAVVLLVKFAAVCHAVKRAKAAALLRDTVPIQGRNVAALGEPVPRVGIAVGLLGVIQLEENVVRMADTVILETNATLSMVFMRAVPMPSVRRASSME